MRNALMLHLNQTGGKCLIDGLAEWRMLHKSDAAAQVYARELVHRFAAVLNHQICALPPKKVQFMEIKWEE